MKFSSEEIKAMWSKAVEEALVIWRDRANGIVNKTSCPFCKIDDLLNEDIKNDCDSCILKNCLTTPYGWWQHYWRGNPDQEKAAGDMVKMLEAYRDGDMELFRRYLNYWDDEEEVCLFEEGLK